MCRCARDAGLDQEHVLGERAEVGVDRVEREHRSHPRLERRVAQAGLRRARVRVAELHRRDRHAVMVGVDQPGQHELALATDDLRIRVRATSVRRRLRPRRSRRRGSAPRRPQAVSASEDASSTSPRTRSSAMQGTLAARRPRRRGGFSRDRQAEIGSLHGSDRRRPRDRDLVRLHLTVLPHRGAPRGVAGAPVRRSAGVVAVRSASRVSAGGDPACRPRRALWRGLRRAYARDVRRRGPRVCAAAGGGLEHAPRARARRRRPRRGAAPRLPRPRHGGLLGRGRRPLSSGRRWSNSRATSVSPKAGSRRRSTTVSGPGRWTNPRVARRLPARPVCRRS